MWAGYETPTFSTGDYQLRHTLTQTFALVAQSFALVAVATYTAFNKLMLMLNISKRYQHPLKCIGINKLGLMVNT
jgi:hypothetical protein